MEMHNEEPRDAAVVTVDSDTLESAAQILSALADPTRLKLLLALIEGPKCVHQLTELVDISQSGVSHQLRMLRDRHIVMVRRDGKHTWYSLADLHVERLITQAVEHARHAGASGTLQLMQSDDGSGQGVQENTSDR